MFDYNGFAASGNVGGFTISIGGNGGNLGGYGTTTYPTYPTTQYPTTYPVSYGGVGGMDDKTMWILLGVVALFVLASK